MVWVWLNSPLYDARVRACPPNLQCFHGHGGRAFLFERCVNVTAGRPEDRMLLTGMHVVADISCASCGSELGWKYVSCRTARLMVEKKPMISNQGRLVFSQPAALNYFHFVLSV